MKTISNLLSSSTIDYSSVHTITVDVFDTILLRDTWPEEVQFIEVAEAWLPYLRREISPSLTVYELVTFRQYVRRVLLAAGPKKDIGANPDPEITIEEWFDELVRQLAEKYSKHLSAVARQEITAELVLRELAIEKRHVHANTSLVRQIAQLKEALSARVYFVSDMYLSAEHIRALLEHVGITLFDGGVTSSELGCGKYSGKLYRCLEECFAEFSIIQNLHIGDSHHADYLAAIAEGSQAVHYRTLHHIRRSLGTRYQGRLLSNYHKRQQKHIRESMLVQRPGHVRPAARIGTLFSAPLVAYMHTVASRAWLQPDVRYIGVSSEATVFKRTHEILFGSHHRLAYAPTLNRKTIMRAVIAEIAKLGKDYSLGMQRIVRYGEDMKHRSALMSLIGAAQSDLLLKDMSDNELRNYFGERVHELRDDALIKVVAKALGLADSSSIVLLDVGWGGTIQVFVREFAALRGYTGTLGGVYMGAQRAQNRFGIERGAMEGLLFDDVLAGQNRSFFVPEIWEYVLSDKSQYNVSGRHRLIHEHLFASVEQWKASVHCAPDAFWWAMRPALLSLLKKPTRAEVEALGSIKFDSGFRNVRYVPLVDMNQSVVKVWVKSFIRPKALLRKLVSQYCWAGGTLRYYRLWHFIPVLKVLALVKGKRYY